MVLSEKRNTAVLFKEKMMLKLSGTSNNKETKKEKADQDVYPNSVLEKDKEISTPFKNNDANNQRKGGNGGISGRNKALLVIFVFFSFFMAFVNYYSSTRGLRSGRGRSDTFLVAVV